MARTLEGGITLVDLTDGQSYYTFVRYSKNADGSGYVVTPTSETIYIGVYAGPLSSPPVYSDSGWTWSKYVGDDGGQGPQGVSVTSGRELYYLTTTGTAPSQITAANQIVSTDTPNRWSSVVATYQTGADYYTCIETTLSNGQKVWSAPSKNIALTTASADAQEAKTIATGINQYFWWIPNDHSTSVPAGVYMTQIPSATFKNTPAGGNIIMRSDGMYIRHGATLDAQVTSSGLTVKKGGIEAGTFNSNNYVYAWSEDRSDRALAINGSGSKTDWRFLAGKQFGVDKAGNLYASGANIQGQVTITAGSNVYTKDEVDDAVGEATVELSALAKDLHDNYPPRSEFTVAPNQIQSEVSKKVGNSEVISKINQSAETVKIQASKVEIDGTATFNAIKSSVENTVNTAVDGIEIGGRNLLSDWAWGRDDNTYTSRGVTVSRLETGLYKAIGTTTETGDIWWGISRASAGGFGDEGNYIYSIYIESGSWPASGIVLQIADANGTSWSRNIRSNNGEMYVAFTIASGHHPCHIGFYSNAANTQLDITFRVKLEKGNKATDWTPAPEDVQAEIDAKKSVHTIDSTYKPNYSTALNWAKTSQTYSNNGINTTGVKVGDTVRLGVLVNDFTGNPTVYVVGTVTAIGSKSSFTMMGKGLDTTIIDGGNILTNSIGANQIKTNVIDTSKLTIGAQNEILNSKIEVGGRNLFISYDSLATAKRKINNATSYTYNAATGVYVIKQTASSTGFIQILTEDGVSDFSSILGKTVTLSARSIVTSRSAAEARVYCYCTKSDGGTYSFILTKNELTRTFVMPTDIVRIGYIIRLDQNTAGSANETATFTGIKLELGNKATDWTPAPEDVQAEIDAKKSVHTLDTNYSYSYANILTYSAEGYSGNWAVASTSGVKVGDTVRLKVTVSDMSNAPVYVIGTVTAINNRTELKMTSHGLDTTIIDGGNILTNSIGANKIKVNELAIGQSQVNGLSTALANTKKLYKHNIDLTSSSYNQDTWYPVLIGPCPSTDASIYFRCSITRGGGTPSWSSHSTKNWACEVEASYSASAWGWKSDDNSYIDAYTFGQTSTKPIVLSNALSNSSYLVVYLRGGGYYPIQTSIADTPQIKTSSYTISSQTVAPTTTQPANTTNFVISRREGDTKTNDAAKTATSYITNVGSDGIRVHPTSTENNSVLINSDGMTVYKGGTADTNSVAFYGDTARIGKIKANSSYLDLIPSKMTLYGTNSSNGSKQLFSVGNLLNTINEDVFYGDGSTTRFLLTVIFSSESAVPSDFTVKVNGVTKVRNTDWKFDLNDSSSSYIKFLNGAPADDSTIVVSYAYNYSAPYVTIGNRKSGTSVKALTIVNGQYCEASGNYSMAFGVRAAATNYGSVAVGYGVTASGNYSHAEGYETTASGKHSHAEGYETTASGKQSHAEGYETTASGDYSHAEGRKTTARGKYSHAEGDRTTANTNYSHAEGCETTASGWYSHAEGYGTKASGSRAHAEGDHTTASHDYSHAEGYETKANGYCSHAQGYKTTALRKSQTVMGEYNVLDYSSDSGMEATKGKYVLIIGNGSDDAHSNALTVSWTGNVELAIDYSATGSSTVDGKIMDSLRSLGWDASTEGVITD